MRLINTKSLDLEEWFGSAIPKYAILSHTWEKEEKIGYRKILAACHQVRRDSLDYLWVDTNCIDKKSSVELIEAINSMFAVTAESTKTAQLIGMEQLYQRRWFTRGWTLQELLAPNAVFFFDMDWQGIGVKDWQADLGFCVMLQKITGIRATYINSVCSIFDAAISESMSWLALRKTTRDEDLAYCMLGIFGTNVPLLYGEGRQAFLRLQEEIIRISNDFCLELPRQ
ncbi:heterokaryon incompatibility protein-domain-containing protein [Xylaria castorea]|nr:heterokaryon incompatibility protein-domain-containing protein [Xylaria castorea]